MLRYQTDRTWFSRLLWHTVRKQSGSILTILEPTLHKGAKRDELSCNRPWLSMWHLRFFQWKPK